MICFFKLSVAKSKIKKPTPKAKYDPLEYVKYRFNNEINIINRLNLLDLRFIYKSSELKKSLVENKINQMKEAAIKEIKDASIKIAIDSVKKIITTSVDKSKLDTLFQKNLDETKEELKKINS